MLANDILVRVIANWKEVNKMKAGMKKKITIIAAITTLLSATATFMMIRRARAASRKTAAQIAITRDKEVGSTANGDLKAEDHVEMEAELDHVEIMVEKEEEPKVTILDVGIQELNLSVRVYNALKLAGVNTLEDLTLKTKEDISEIRNLGSKSLVELDVKLKKMGYALRLDQS